ncbi:MAG TPA: hypothetical protein VF602_13920 [Pedobacter sp.]|jgi:hypothetical protein
MKRVILLLLPIILGLNACKKEYIVPNKTVIVNLATGSWIPLNGGTSYTAAVNVPQLDDYINEKGGVLVYISFGAQTYEQLPQVYDGDAFSFVTRPGQIVLEVQRFNGAGLVTPPGGMTIKIVIIESNY